MPAHQQGTRSLEVNRSVQSAKSGLLCIGGQIDTTKDGLPYFVIGHDATPRHAMGTWHAADLDLSSAAPRPETPIFRTLYVLLKWPARLFRAIVELSGGPSTGAGEKFSRAAVVTVEDALV